jgi:predicted XRE-type DNA-binding protein
MSKRNAFSAFGFEADHATIDTLRTDLAFALRQFIERGRMSQTRAAHLLGLKQSVVSQIVRGDIEHLSVERLIRAMVRARITGFAEWGESPELARAGAGFRTSTVASVVVNVPMDPSYQELPVNVDNAGGVPAMLRPPPPDADEAH